MIKVLIADDEEIIREGLISCIEWDRLGLSPVAIARDGQEALMMAKQKRPDICLVDIMMPVMSGLDFIEALKQAYPETVVIIISGYDEFSYAQKAVKLKTFDYLLKPIDETELNNTLKNAVDYICENKETESRIKALQSNLEGLHPQALDHFIGDCLNGKIDMAIREEFCLTYGIILKNCFSVITVPRRNIRNADRDTRWIDRSELFEKITEAAAEKKSADAEVLHIDTNERGIDIVVQTDSEEAAESFEEHFRETVLEKLGYEIETYRETREEGPECLHQMMDEISDRITHNSRYTTLMRKVKEYIDGNYMDSSVSLNKIAQMFNTSEGNISRKFKQEMKTSYSNYIETKRIETAAQMLLADDSKIYEVAEKTGYTSQHYFCTVFRKMMGCTPTDFKRKYQNGDFS